MYQQNHYIFWLMHCFALRNYTFKDRSVYARPMQNFSALRAAIKGNVTKCYVAIKPTGFIKLPFISATCCTVPLTSYDELAFVMRKLSPDLKNT